MNKIARFASYFLSLAVIAGSIYGIFHRQQILDFFALRNYTPTERISQLVSDTTMTPQMRRTFYASHPELDSKENFRDKCPAGEQTIVLGCYVSSRGIFVLDVSDERLNGIIQVTTAHEALHAAYDRLSKAERANVDRMTSEAYKNVTNDRIKKTVEQYRSNDSSVVPNELHSILGTEVRDLPPELESYYKKYFNDRSKIVAYSENYEQTFVNLSNQVDKYDDQLKSLKNKIDSNQAEIEGLNNELESKKSQLDSMINSGRTEEYNAAVPGFNSQVNEYNSLIGTTRSLISQYNDIVAKRNEIATTEQQLVEAINSNTLPKEAQ